MKLFRSLAFRLAITYLGLFGLSVAALLGLYYWFSIVQPLDHARDRVTYEADLLSDTYIAEGQSVLLSALEMRARGLDVRKPFHAFIARDGKTMSANLPSWPEQPRNGWTLIEADLYRDGDEADHDALAIDRVFADGARLIVGRDIEDITERQETLSESILWIIVFTVLLGMVGGTLMSRVISARIETINSAARMVIAGDLSERIPLRGSGDDFDQLAETLNYMLARINESVEAVRRVSDSVAHELRTPLARLQADLEDLFFAGSDEKLRQRLIQNAIEEAARLNVVFDALLRIARIEGGRHEMINSTVNITAVVTDAIDFYSPQADATSILLQSEIAEHLIVIGDKNLLFQAISNLLDNAIKFSPKGGAVHISGRVVNSDCLIVICDEGPGLAHDDVEHVTERFYRGERTASYAGIGLGLSLVAAVVELHRAGLSFKNKTPGLCVELMLPLRTPN